jgi:hypothetical protein
MADYLPSMRAEKTNTVRDDFRVAIAGILFCILLLLGQNWVLYIYDKIWAERPFVEAELTIYQVQGRERPMLFYDADATQPVDGIWVASIYAASDQSRLQTRRGDGSYNANVDDPKLWTWQGFFDNEVSDTPDVPNEPFYICLRYIVETRDSGVDDEGPSFCSVVFDPADPTFIPFRGDFEDDNP